ncbi:hypothetical protein DXP76_11055 [Listeria monocytogenes serotype 3b]|nr:hypothetical protein [Listeria monocytogenes serotype 3b]
MTTKKAFTDEEYFKLSEAVYQDGTLNSKKINIELSDRTKSNWKVVSKLNDKATDTQAFAVVPEEKGKNGRISYNYNNMVFVYRGTKESKDFGSDIINVFAGTNTRTSLDRKSTNPFQVSEKWTKEVLKEFNPKNPTSTGHSLGGALSHYNSILHDFNATTYAAPNIYQLLPEDKQKKVREGFYNPDEFERYYEMNHQTCKLLKNFQIELIDAAQSFRETDTYLGEWISNNN